MNRLTENQKEEIIALRGLGLTYNAIASRIGCSNRTASYYVNLDKAKRDNSDYYQRNREYILIKRKQHDPVFYIQNREAILAYKKEYYEKNKDPDRVYDWTLRSKRHIRNSHVRSLERQLGFVGHSYTDITQK